jgi:hypothetical protein
VDFRACLDGRGKFRHPPRFDPRTAQPLASRYADCAIPAPNTRNLGISKSFEVSLILQYDVIATGKANFQLPSSGTQEYKKKIHSS